MPHMGLLYLATAVRRAGMNPMVVDAPAEGLDPTGVLDRFDRFAPDVLGLTAVTPSVDGAGRIAEAARGRHPGCRTVIGGPHATALPGETLARFGALDAVCVGEGEQTLVELIRAWASGKPPEAVSGVVARNGSGPARERVRDLDDLGMPSWDLVPGFPHRYRPAAMNMRRMPAAQLVTSRGCPHRCVFCDCSVHGKSVRAHSPDAVVEMVERLVRVYRVREILFEDDRFLADEKRVGLVCEKLLSRDVRVSWSCAARPESVRDGNLLTLMRHAGCWRVNLGVESGDGRVLELARKDASLEDARRAVRLCRESRLAAKGFFILGLFGETESTLARTVNFALELPLTDASVFFHTPYPGSEAWSRADAYGRLERDYPRMTMMEPVFVPEGLDAATLWRAHREFSRRFYLRPGVVARHARRLLSHPGAAPRTAWAAAGLVRHAFGGGEA